MRQSWTIAVAFFFVSQFVHAAGWHGKVFQLDGLREIPEWEFVQKLRVSQNIVLGEKHDTEAVQAAQERIIRSVVTEANLNAQFSLVWEFLNFTAQKTIDESFARFVAGEIDATQFLIQTEAHTHTTSYNGVLTAVKELGGRVLGGNLSREQKKPVLSGGVQALDPALLPPGFELGDKDYLERFKEAMGGHTPPEKLANYFAAQCLTDDVIAYHMLQASNSSIRFLIVGSFHSDYQDGVVNRLKFRAPGDVTLNVKILDASDYSEAELMSALTHPKYGAIADYVYVVNEPK